MTTGRINQVSIVNNWEAFGSNEWSMEGRSPPMRSTQHSGNPADDKKRRGFYTMIHLILQAGKGFTPFVTVVMTCFRKCQRSETSLLALCLTYSTGHFYPSDSTKISFRQSRRSPPRGMYSPSQAIGGS
jgi:hypothetical protein